MPMTIMLLVHQRTRSVSVEAPEAPVVHQTYMETTRFTKPGSRKAPHWSSGASMATEIDGQLAGSNRRRSARLFANGGETPARRESSKGCDGEEDAEVLLCSISCLMSRSSQLLASRPDPRCNCLPPTARRAMAKNKERRRMVRWSSAGGSCRWENATGNGGSRAVERKKEVRSRLTYVSVLEHRGRR